MTIVDLSSRANHSDAHALAVEILGRNEPIIIPTDTVYGLAVAAADHIGRTEIFKAKKRPSAQTLAILVADLEQAATLVEVDDVFTKLAAAFWPGALTIVAPPARGVDATLGAEDGWIGVRAPKQPWVRELAAAVGPIAATSANLHGEPTPSDCATLHHTFPETTLFDGGPGGTVASTVLRLEASDPLPFLVLREGGIGIEELRSVVAK